MLSEKSGLPGRISNYLLFNSGMDDESIILNLRLLRHFFPRNHR